MDSAETVLSRQRCLKKVLLLWLIASSRTQDEIFEIMAVYGVVPVKNFKVDIASGGVAVLFHDVVSLVDTNDDV